MIIKESIVVIKKMKEILLAEKETVFLGLLYFHGISESVHAEREGKTIEIKVLKKVIGRSHPRKK